MDQEIFDWILLLARWAHITTSVTWIGTSIFFMWLDRSFKANSEIKSEGHVGELWMVHGGGFYRVEKMLLGPTKVPEELHWFKWEAYWTWMTGMFLLIMTFYSGEGSFLLDSSVSDISYFQAILIGLFSVFGSWFFYDFLWERKICKNKPLFGHTLTLLWFAMMAYYLCHKLSGRAAYIHIGAMLGTWMTANVFMRIIPRQIKMVKASQRGEGVNQDWGKNAKNRSTHNTYFTLPVIFIMLSNHFPATYGHEYNWVILLLLSAAGASIRAFFVNRLKKTRLPKIFAVTGVLLILFVIGFSRDKIATIENNSAVLNSILEDKQDKLQNIVLSDPTSGMEVSGKIYFKGIAPKGKVLNLPSACAKQYSGPIFSDEVIVSDGKLMNSLVHITKGLEGKKFSDIPKEVIELDQRGCIYRPHVLAVRVGQQVEFKNSDPLFHNVKALTQNNQSFNMAMPKKDQREIKIFNSPEIFLQTKCSVHPWMGAYIAVMDNPFYSISNQKGEYSIKNLAPGKYTLEVWHEVFGTQTQEVEVFENKNLIVDFSFNQ